MSAQDYTVDAFAVGCCRGAHVWDSPDGFVPQDGRQVTCRVCPATARAKPEARGQGYAQGLLSRVLDESAVDAARYRVLLAAMVAAMDETPDASPPEAFNQAALATFWAAIHAIRQAPSAAPPEPECSYGHPEDAHIRSDWSPTRPCDECGCRNYAATREPECSYGNPECGGCYPSAHGGSEP